MQDEAALEAAAHTADRYAIGIDHAALFDARQSVSDHAYKDQSIVHDVLTRRDDDQNGLTETLPLASACRGDQGRWLHARGEPPACRGLPQRRGHGRTEPTEGRRESGPAKRLEDKLAYL